MGKSSNCLFVSEMVNLLGFPMNKFFKNVVVGVVVIGFCVNSGRAITEKTATIGAVGGGVVLGLIAGGLTYGATNPSLSGNKSIIPAFFVGVGTVAVSWWLLDQLLATFTPKGRINAAKNIVRWVESDSVLMREFTSDELVSYINARFGSSWPLVLAREHVMSLTRGIDEVFNLVARVRQDLEEDDSFGFSTKGQEFERKACFLMRALELRMNLIINHKDYQFQVKLYEKHQEAVRQREHDMALKAGERAHESWERSKDRRHESEEKERDRQLKQQALDSALINHGPVMVSV